MAARDCKACTAQEFSARFSCSRLLTIGDDQNAPHQRKGPRPNNGRGPGYASLPTIIRSGLLLSLRLRMLLLAARRTFAFLAFFSGHVLVLHALAAVAGLLLAGLRIVARSLRLVAMGFVPPWPPSAVCRCGLLPGLCIGFVPAAFFSCGCRLCDSPAMRFSSSWH